MAHMKTIALILSLVFSLSSFAGVQEVVNDHRYFLTVEWDQKDQAALELSQKQFAEKISAFSEEEIDQFMKENLSQEQYMLARNNGPAELLNQISPKGASWNAFGTGLLIVGGVTLTLFAAYTWYIYNSLVCDGFYDCHGGE